MLKPQHFFSDNDITLSLFKPGEHIWEGLKNIKACIKSFIRPNTGGIKISGPVVTQTVRLDNNAVVNRGAFLIGDDIEIGADVVIEPGAYIKGPVIIGPGTVVRHAAYIRGNVLIGCNCVVGHSTEIKNSVMLGNSKAGHFAYIGDSILGKVNLGAGTKLANLKFLNSDITVTIQGKSFNTGLRKFGAIMGDGCQTGCNSVTSPGTVMSRDVLLYPNATATGYYTENTIIKLRQDIEIRRDDLYE